MNSTAPILREAQLHPRSRHHEAVHVVQRTSRCIDAELGRLLVQHGLTLAQYNVLRILRDARATAIATLAIAESMVDRTPGITRLLDRLERQSLVRRERGRDRRQVLCRLTPIALELLEILDPQILSLEERVFHSLTLNEVGALTHLLNRVCATIGSQIRNQ